MLRLSDRIIGRDSYAARERERERRRVRIARRAGERPTRRGVEQRDGRR